MVIIYLKTMNDKHTITKKIKYGKNTSAFLLKTKPKTLVVYIHGFTGSSYKTWGDFPELIKNQNDFKFADIVFYGYKSLREKADYTALQFYEFLTEVCENNPKIFSDFSRENIEQDFRYHNVLIVAHSLGAIIARRALVNAKRNNKSWLENCKMILFAPAHRGAKHLRLFENIGIVGRILLSGSACIIPALKDLGANSKSLKDLITTSQKYIDEGEGNFTIAQKVLWAHKDNVVDNKIFCNDPKAVEIKKESHTTICKPRANFLASYEIVINAL